MRCRARVPNGCLERIAASALGWRSASSCSRSPCTCSPTRRGADFYDHFVWQAHAFLEGRAEIEWPVTSGPYQNGYFQDVLPLPGTGLAQLPFPPLPALVLLPFVAVFGLGTNGAVVAAVLGAVNVALCWLVLVARHATA